MNTPKHLLRALLVAGGLALLPLAAIAQDQAAPATPHHKLSASLVIDPHDEGAADAGKGKVTITASAGKQVEVDLGDDNEGHHRHDNALVMIGHDASLAAGEKTDAVVAVLGNASSAGEVASAVVSVLGDAHVTGPVGDSVVAVLGNVYVDAPVQDNVVAVLGDVELGPNAVVNGEVVAFGGTLTRDPAAQVHGSVQTITMFHGGGALAGFRAWVHHALLYARPLAIAPGLGWAWAIAGAFLALYLLMALVFPAGIERCVRTMEESPGRSLLAALLTLLLKPVVLLLVFITVIGIVLVPFLAVAMMVIGLFGKAVALAWLGRRLLPKRPAPETWFTALTVLAGGLVVTALYLVPVLGFVVYKGLDILGVGIVVYTLILMSRAARAASAPPPAAAGTPPPAAAAAAAAAADPAATVGAAASAGSGAEGATAADAAAGTSGAAAPGPAPAPPPADAAVLASYPRAGFWIRMVALLVDFVLVGVVCSALRIPSHGALLVVLAGYGAIMWKLRGSTVGDIIFSLRVVRQDGRELDWPTAIVRALGCFLSFVVLCLGFLWIAFDGERQGWHDKIAGTLVVRVPKAQPLV